MLRITLHDRPDSQTIKLEGKLAGLWIEELNRTWRAAAASLGSRELLCDLRGVTFVDRCGIQLLREIRQKNNATFLADSPLTKYFAEEAMKCSGNDAKQGV